jgi:hypothetical protein
MSRHFRPILLGFLWASIGAWPTANEAGAQQLPEVKVEGLHIAYAQDPKSIWKLLSEAANNPLTKGAIQAAAAYFGVPPDYVEVVAEGAKLLSANEKGEEMRPHWAPPAGYRVCNGRVIKPK